jgi:hypothetical protein
MVDRSRILEAQPMAANAMLDLWAKAIENGQANLEAANASIQEIKRGWNLSRSIDILI